MIRQWEILHYPSERDSNRYRLSLWSDGDDVAKVRSLFPGRAGALWVPRRKPYNSSFFLYDITGEEKTDLEMQLRGEVPFPEDPLPFVAARAVDETLGKEDTQEVVLIDGAAQDEKEVTTGLGKTPKEKRSIRVGYFVPAHYPDAGEKVHEILSHTLQDKKVSVTFEKIFSLNYDRLSLKEMHDLLKECQSRSVNRVVAIGDQGAMETLCKIAKKGGIFVKPLSESVINRNLWLTLIAELISHE